MPYECGQTVTNNFIELKVECELCPLYMSDVNAGCMLLVHTDGYMHTDQWPCRAPCRKWCTIILDCAVYDPSLICITEQTEARLCMTCDSTSMNCPVWTSGAVFTNMRANSIKRLYVN